MTRITNRRAVTLTEVLIAIFLMGIGLMAILSLFPLGASQMAQAIQDQRAAESATTAAAVARTVWKVNCDADPNDGQMKFYASDGSPQSPQPFIVAMDNPNLGTSVQIPSMQAMPRAGAIAVAGAPSATGASYPVLVDPIGWQANGSVSAALQSWVAYPGSGSQACIPRRPLYVRQPGSTSWVSICSPSNQLPMLKQFSLMDDMTFSPNGTPNVPTGQVERQGRYSWAFLFRRANNADRTAVDITTILYSGRSLDVASQETMYAGSGAYASKSLTLAYSSTKPAIRRGGWVLDATLGNDDTGKPAPQGIFYRVVNVDDSTAGQLALELQTQLLGGPSGQNQRSIVVMDKVIEVFTKKDVSNLAPPMPY